MRLQAGQADCLISSPTSQQHSGGSSLASGPLGAWAGVEEPAASSCCYHRAHEAAGDSQGLGRECSNNWVQLPRSGAIMAAVASHVAVAPSTRMRAVVGADLGASVWTAERTFMGCL